MRAYLCRHLIYERRMGRGCKVRLFLVQHAAMGRNEERKRESDRGCPKGHGGSEPPDSPVHHSTISTNAGSFMTLAQLSSSTLHLTSKCHRYVRTHVKKSRLLLDTTRPGSFTNIYIPRPTTIISSSTSSYHPSTLSPK